MRRSIATLLSVVFVTAAGAATAAAQETVNFASVGGRVTDPQGAVIRGASVTARHTETNVTASTTSDDEGRFRFPYLRIGAYEITARHSGFADARRALTLTLGAAYELRLSLGLGEVTATLTVTAQATVLETARSQIAGTIAQAEVQSLPFSCSWLSWPRCARGGNRAASTRGVAGVPHRRGRTRTTLEAVLRSAVRQQQRPRSRRSCVLLLPDGRRNGQ